MMQLPDKDNEFDDLIKAAADKYNASGAAPDWDKMQALLDTEMPVKKRPRRGAWYFLLIPLFLLLGVIYLLIHNLSNSSIPDEDKQALTTKGQAASPKTVDPATKPTDNNDHPEQPVETTQDKNKIEPGSEHSSNQPTVPSIAGIKNNGGKTPVTERSQNSTESYSPQQELTGRSKAHHQKRNTAGNTKLTSRAGETAENDLPQTAGKDPLTDKNAAEAKTSDSANNVSIQPKTADTANNKLAGNKILPKLIKTKTSVGKRNSKKSPGKNPFEISLLYAPEFTTIGFSHIDKPGSNYGILAGYQIFKNISIQTGLIKSKKNYTANGTDYKLYYTVPQPFKLTSVKGYCNMYEIPLNIKYDISQRKNFTIYAIAGVSSYFMTAESYTFRYNSYDSTYNRSRKYSSQKNYWFSLATIAVGLEQDISKNLSIGASPFLKIPFKGMGSGELKLLGAGINFSLSYRPSFNK